MIKSVQDPGLNSKKSLNNKKVVLPPYSFNKVNKQSTGNNSGGLFSPQGISVNQNYFKNFNSPQNAQNVQGFQTFHQNTSNTLQSNTPNVSASLYANSNNSKLLKVKSDTLIKSVEEKPKPIRFTPTSTTMRSNHESSNMLQSQHQAQSQHRHQASIQEHLNNEVQTRNSS